MSSLTGKSGLRGATGGGSSAPKVPGYNAVNTFTPDQMQLFQQLFGHLSPDSFTSKLASGDQSAFGEVEAPALRQFSGIQGNIASRFSQGGGGSGAIGSRRSSGFQNTMTSAASNFAQELQSQRQGLQRQALGDLFSMSDSLLNKKPYAYMEKQQPFWQQLLLSLGPAAGQFAGHAATMGASSFMGGM